MSVWTTIIKSHLISVVISGSFKGQANRFVLRIRLIDVDIGLKHPFTINRNPRLFAKFFIPPGVCVRKSRGVFGFGPKGNRTSKLQCKGRQESLLGIWGVGVRWGLAWLHLPMKRCKSRFALNYGLSITRRLLSGKLLVDKAPCEDRAAGVVLGNKKPREHCCSRGI